MSTVVSLTGDPIPSPGEADEEIVAMLERHLADAKSGTIVAVAISTVDNKGWTLSQFAVAKSRFTLLGAVSNLMHRLNEAIENQDE